MHTKSAKGKVQVIFFTKNDPIKINILWACFKSFNILMHNAPNGQTHFANFAANAAVFFKFVRPFWDILQWNKKSKALEQAQSILIKIFKVCLTILGYYAPNYYKTKIKDTLFRVQILHLTKPVFFDLT